MKKPKIITVCASTSFYNDILHVEKELEKFGYKVLVPEDVHIMKKDKKYDAEKIKTEVMIKNKNYELKKKYIDLHIEEIKKADAILVVNNEKKDIKGYIGGNVLMEMTVAYFLKKPIFLWKSIEDIHPFVDEVRAIGSISIDQDISNIKL